MADKEFYKQTTVQEMPIQQVNEPVPERIGPYAIESFLRKGGMSILYLGIDPDSKKTLVIKVLSPEYVNTEGTARQFIQEAEIIKKTSHPNIVTLYGEGEWEGGLYIAMEFIQGVSLRQFITQHSLSLKRCIDIVLQVAYALTHLHTYGIIHRDLKPENILITEEGLIKVIDFGIAQLHEETPVEEGGFIGTPDYMSPEQKANPKNASFLSDIYSLGVITYELLIGKLSYGIIHTSLLPKGLRSIVEKAIAISEDQRYPDIVNFITDLTQYLRSGAIDKERPGTDQWKELLEQIQESEQTINQLTIPSSSNIDIGIAKMKAPGQVGLYYYALSLKEHTFGFLAWESLEENLSASLYGAMLYGTVRSLLLKEISKEKLLEEINRFVLQNPIPCKFRFSAIFLEPWENRLSYLSCNMGMLFLLPAGESSIRFLPSENPSLGELDQELLLTSDNWNIGDSVIFSSFSHPGLAQVIEQNKNLSLQRQAEFALNKVVDKNELYPQKKPKILLSMQRIA